MVQAVALHAPNALAIPLNDRGRQNFKLDQLAPANGFAHEDAHDAMADVEATIFMCRLIAERTPDLWESFTRFAQKAPVSEFINGEDIVCLTDFYYARPYSWLVTAVGQNPENGAEILAFDLANDPVDLMRLTDDELAARLATRPRVVRSIRTNAAPIVRAYDGAPLPLREAAPDLAELRRRAAIIKDDAGLRERLVTAYLAGRNEREPAAYVEEQIYDGFITGRDQTLLGRFHVVEWPERTGLIGALSDERLRLLGNRLVYSEAPDLMPEAVRHEYDLAIARRLMTEAGTVPWLTLPQAMTEATDFLAGASGAEAALLRGHHDRLQQQADWAASLLT